jgi:lanosterol synthase
MNDFWNLFDVTTHDGKHHWSFNFNGKKIAIFSKENNSVTEPLLHSQLESIRNNFIYDKSKNANSSDLIVRQLYTKNFKEFDLNTLPKNASKELLANIKGLNYFSYLQCDEGHFPNDYGGPMFLLPGLVITSYISKTYIQEPFKTLIAQYMRNQVNSDGGWGLHIEGHSTMFGTVLQYVSLRLLGEDKDAPLMQNARKWILENGGATGIPSWGKFYLSVLGVYEWEGCNSVFPEIWLLPKWLPIHPWRYWCHARMVYLPMAYCYGLKVKGEETTLVKEIRNEIYTEEYNKINWSSARNSCCEKDVFRKSTSLMKLMNKLTSFYEKIRIPFLRKKARDYILSYIQAEDIHTNYINIGPVNQMINSICIWHKYGRESDFFQKHIDRWQDYLWLAEDGLKMQGYNGSHLWDVVFCMQAITEGGMEKYFPEMVKKGYRFMDKHQIKNNVDEKIRFFRHQSKGGWPFSTVFHGWPITDCSAEGVKTTLMIEETDALLDTEKTITLKRLYDPINTILSFQNKDGGWASYENTRAPKWMELLNPSEIFGEIMIDYSYVECTSASIQGLSKFYNTEKNYRTTEISTAIKNGIDFIYSQQREDGSWYGCWGVCFTYAIWFGIDALVATKDLDFIDKDKSVANINKACSFLVSKQNIDGGWGESYQSCVTMEYVQHESSQIINTAWALMALIQADFQDISVIQKGIDFLISKQEPNGDWPQEGISGVFNKNCMETYTSYRNVFPIWAISRYIAKYQKQ